MSQPSVVEEAIASARLRQRIRQIEAVYSTLSTNNDTLSSESDDCIYQDVANRGDRFCMNTAWFCGWYVIPSIIVVYLYMYV